MGKVDVLRRKPSDSQQQRQGGEETEVEFGFQNYVHLAQALIKSSNQISEKTSVSSRPASPCRFTYLFTKYAWGDTEIGFGSSKCVGKRKAMK